MSPPVPKFGDLVKYNIPGVGPGEGYVLGVMKYADHVILLGTEQSHGMPISRFHCRVISRRHDGLCGRLRQRYVDKYGAHLLKAS